jgi:hypothetical protein
VTALQRPSGNEQQQVQLRKQQTNWSLMEFLASVTVQQLRFCLSHMLLHTQSGLGLCGLLR